VSRFLPDPIASTPAAAASTFPLDAAAAPLPLQARGVEKRFGRGRQVLAGVELTVGAGEVVALLGANGCGKSTFLRCAVRLTDIDAGSIEIAGHDLSALRGKHLREARRSAAMVFQQVNMIRRRTAVDNVAFGALGRIGGRRSMTSRTFPPDVQDAAFAALDRVGLLDRSWDRVGTLSGGQAQRVAIARALCQRASVILADEPVASLDPRAAETVLELLVDVARQERLAVLCVLHQPDLARRYADRVVGMIAGRVVFDRRPSELGEDEVARLYVGEVDGGGDH
jgi:phosphonate transport system ATP-binding protein